MPRETGTVKWFSNDKGFGFIEREGREDVFVHHSQIEMDGFRTLEPGEAVEFDLTSSDKGPKAQRVERLNADGGMESEDGGTVPAETSPNGGAPSADTSSREDRTPDREAKQGSDTPVGGAAPTLAEQLRSKLGKRLFGS